MKISEILHSVPCSRSTPLKEYRPLASNITEFLSVKQGRTLSLVPMVVRLAYKNKYSLKVTLKTPNDINMDQLREEVDLAGKMNKLKIKRIVFKSGVTHDHVMELFSYIRDSEMTHSAIQKFERGHIEIEFSRPQEQQKVLGVDGLKLAERPQEPRPNIIGTVDLPRSPKEPEPGTLLTPSRSANELTSKAQDLFHDTTGGSEINDQLRIDIKEWIRQANLFLPDLIKNQKRFGWSKETARLFRFYRVFGGPLGNGHETLKIKHKKLKVPRFEGDIFTLPNSLPLKVSLRELDQESIEKVSQSLESYSLSELLSEGRSLWTRAAASAELDSDLICDLVGWITAVTAMIPKCKSLIGEKGWSQEIVLLFQLYRDFQEPLGFAHEQLILENLVTTVPEFKGWMKDLPEKLVEEKAQKHIPGTQDAVRTPSPVVHPETDSTSSVSTEVDFESLTLEEFVTRGKRINKQAIKNLTSQVREEALLWIKYAKVLIDIRNEEIQGRGWSQENVAEFGAHRTLSDQIVKFQQRLGLEEERLEVKQLILSSEGRIRRLPKSYRRISDNDRTRR